MNGLDRHILLWYRHVWQPARYAHPDWLIRIGMYRKARAWHYGQQPKLDRCLDLTLRRIRGGEPMTLPGKLTVRQQRIIALNSRLMTVALALGLVQLACGDYLLLPDYRAVIHPWVSDELAWQLYGLCGGKREAVMNPAALVAVALELGISCLSREARHEPVWQALLIALPPPTRALWPRFSPRVLTILERIL